jgi:hypothetical protein
MIKYKIPKKSMSRTGPSRKILAVTLGFAVANDARKSCTGNNLQELAEETRITFHGKDFLMAVSYC